MLLLGLGLPGRDVSGLSCEWREGHEWRGLYGEPRRICSKRARKLCLLFGRADDVVTENVMFAPQLVPVFRPL
jgi:hypothetical protein